MKKWTYVEDCLVAINSVKRRIKVAQEKDSFEVVALVQDLAGLEACLVIESEKLVEELEKMAS